MPAPPDLVRPTDRGLFCEAGDFHVDPWKPVGRAVITHAHSDHATWGCDRYLTSGPGVPVLRQRVQEDARIDGLPYGEPLDINGVRVSLHPAGHLLGSAQVRLEHAGRVTVITGDYKTQPDPTCAPFEPVRCDTFITESTFGLPVYRWPNAEDVYKDINQWWRQNAAEGRTSIVFVYALGKAQRVLAGLDPGGIDGVPGGGKIGLHGAVQRFVDVYKDAGVVFPACERVTPENRSTFKKTGLVLAPGSTLGTPWLRKFGPMRTAFVSGWMMIRGTRRRRGVDRGFVLSDHVDWPNLLATIEATGADRIGVTHGYTRAVTRYLTERGRDAFIVPTRYTGETDDDPGTEHTENPEASDDG